MRNLRLSPVQRGLLEKLIKRGKPVEIEVIGAILNWRVPQSLKNTTVAVKGSAAQREWRKFLPFTLCKYLFPSTTLEIKREPYS